MASILGADAIGGELRQGAAGRPCVSGQFAAPRWFPSPRLDDLAPSDRTRWTARAPFPLTSTKIEVLVSPQGRCHWGWTENRSLRRAGAVRIVRPVQQAELRDTGQETRDE